MNTFQDAKVSVCLHYSEKLPYGKDGFDRIFKAINNQTVKPVDILVISEDQEQNLDLEQDNVKVIKDDLETQAQNLKKAVELSGGNSFVYIDNRESEVILKKSYIETALMASERRDDLGMLYGDYELESQGNVDEIHLLGHHKGRVRDNQDFGKVFFFPMEVIEKSSIINTEIKYNPLYDIRLRISEQYDLVHISNRYSGSLYKVVAPPKESNVFDYLMDSEESQKEAEEIVTEHLKRIGAYLPPGEYYQERREEDTELTASVVIPVNNRPEFIGTALQSVFQQTVDDIEAIVVVNGGESDPTVDAVKKFMPGGEKYDESNPDVKLVVTDINNIGLCLNLGAKAASGKYYIQLDSDDRLKSDAIEKVVNKFQSNKKLGMIIGSYEVWEKAGDDYKRKEEIPVVKHDEWTEENGRNNLLRVNGAGAPRCIPFSVIEDIGYFDMNDKPFARNYGEDYDMVLRISEQYKIGRIWDPLYEVVRHEGGTDHAIDQITENRNNRAKDHMRLEAIERRIELNKDQD